MDGRADSRELQTFNLAWFRTETEAAPNTTLHLHPAEVMGRAHTIALLLLAVCTLVIAVPTINVDDSESLLDAFARTFGLQWPLVDNTKSTELPVTADGPVTNRPPIMLIPPMIGSVITGEDKDAPSPHWYCRKSHGKRVLWPPKLTELIPGVVDCWARDFALDFNATTGSNVMPPNIKTSVDNTLGSLIGKKGVYNQIAALLASLGYVEETDLRGFPYDWRDAPDNFFVAGGAYEQLKAAIEAQSSANGNRPVLAMGMSMGAPWFAMFLAQYVDQAWKDQYIVGFVSLSGVFAGAPVALQNQLSASNGWSAHKVPSTISGAFLKIARSFGSVTWFSPVSSFWKDTVFVNTTGGTQYTPADFKKMFMAAGAEGPAKMVDAMSQHEPTKPVGVPTWVLYGWGVSTPVVYTYDKEDLSDLIPTATFADGDGVGPRASMTTVVDRWRAAQKENIYMQGFYNVTHAGTLSEPCVFSVIVDVIKNISTSTAPGPGPGPNE